MNPEIIKQIESSGTIPSPPQIVARLLQVTRDPDYKQSDVVRLLSSDAGVVSDILRLANSVLLGGGRKLASIDDALVRLGIRRVRTMVIGRSMIDQVNTGRHCEIDTSYYWRRSLATGVLAARFAEQITGVQRDAAFMAGLLCDVGVVILARAMPPAYHPAAECYAPRRAEDLVNTELDSVGLAHPEVSAWALEKWGLPPEIVTAVRYHHSEALPETPAPVTRTAGILNGASELARLLCESSNKPAVRGVCTWAAGKAGLPLSALSSVLRHIEADVTELAGHLRVDVIPSRVYALIAEGIAEELAMSAAM
ncbi:HDOD domain protein [Phycisphaerae bacterium RAS1]|nr:HDOD domain protein [Phycisphaerae bacterium RAS1]